MSWTGTRVEFTAVEAPELTAISAGQALLATHKPMLDAGRMQDGAPQLAATARRSVAFLSSATLAGLGLAEDDLVTVSTEHGSITLPAENADLPDGVVWVPECSADSMVHMSLGASAGAVVTLSAAATRGPLLKPAHHGPGSGIVQPPLDVHGTGRRTAHYRSYWRNSADPQ